MERIDFQDLKELEIMNKEINWHEFDKLPGDYEARKKWLRENVPGYAESQDKYTR